MAKLIVYDNGVKTVWDGRADVHYHGAKIISQLDLLDITDEETKQLKQNPNDQNLLLSIQSRKKVVR